MQCKQHCVSASRRTSAILKRCTTTNVSWQQSTDHGSAPLKTSISSQGLSRTSSSIGCSSTRRWGAHRDEALEDIRRQRNNRNALTLHINSIILYRVSHLFGELRLIGAQNVTLRPYSSKAFYIPSCIKVH